MNLVIDIGNTRNKVAVFREEYLQHLEHVANEDLLDRLSVISGRFPVSRAILSHVARLERESIDRIGALFPLVLLDKSTPLPFKNAYGTPATLGVDRIALVAAAVTQFPGQNVLVIDAGSCITYDFVSEKAVYPGGAISPGVEMRYKAVHQFTANLPLLSKKEEIPTIGNSTENAIHLGILNGVICEIEGVIDQYMLKNKKLTVVLTGGDTNFLAKNLKSSIFATPNFLLEGLNSILIHNKVE